MWVVDKEHQEQVRKDAERINKSMELLITDLVHSEPTYLKLNPELVSLLVDALWSTQLRPVEKYFERFPEEFERYQKLAQDIQAAEETSFEEPKEPQVNEAQPATQDLVTGQKVQVDTIIRVELPDDIDLEASVR